MSTKVTIRYQTKEGEQPGWSFYTEVFEPDDVLYLELEGVQADITMIGNMQNAPGTVLLRLPAATAKQLGYGIAGLGTRRQLVKEVSHA